MPLCGVVARLRRDVWVLWLKVSPKPKPQKPCAGQAPLWTRPTQRQSTSGGLRGALSPGRWPSVTACSSAPARPHCWASHSAYFPRMSSSRASPPLPRRTSLKLQHGSTRLHSLLRFGFRPLHLAREAHDIVLARRRCIPGCSSSSSPREFRKHRGGRCAHTAFTIFLNKKYPVSFVKSLFSVQNPKKILQMAH